VCAWGGGPPGGQLALETDVGRRKNDAWQRQRHVLAALAKGIISGRRPATLRRWGEARRLVCAACSMIHEPIDGGWLMERVGAFPAKIRRHQHYRQIRGGWGVRLWLAHEFRREWKSGRRAALRHTFTVGRASRLTHSTRVNSSSTPGPSTSCVDPSIRARSGVPLRSLAFVQPSVFQKSTCGLTPASTRL
jgi:hypothetical protein